MKHHVRDTHLFLWKLFLFLRYGDLCWPHLNEQPCWRCNHEDYDFQKAAALRRLKQAIIQRSEHP